MWKYQQKEHKKYKGSLSTWRITSKPEPVYAYKRHVYKKNCGHELINGESVIKGEGGKILQN